MSTRQSRTAGIQTPRGRRSGRSSLVLSEGGATDGFVRASATKTARIVTVAVLVLASVLGLQVAGALRAPSASAAPGDAFDGARPKIFVSSGAGATVIYRAVVRPDGTFEFAPEGTPGPTINGLAFNTVDNYLYATDAAQGRLIKIGQGGVVVDTSIRNGNFPETQNTATFAPGTNTYYSAGARSDTLFITDVGTGASRQVALSQNLNASDITFKDGYLWGFRLDGSAVRVNPNDGRVDVFPGIIEASEDDQIGSMWTFGNGNLGALRNDSGKAYQIRVANPASGSPGFLIVSRSTGPSSTNNDATSAPGAPVDMAIDKEGPASAAPGDPIQYTFTVTNNGAGFSSGSTVSDFIPPAVTNPRAQGGNCTFTGQSMQCLMPPLDPGQSATFTVSGTIDAGFTGELVNTAGVLGNEEDPNRDNNLDTTTAIVQSASISLDKTAGTPVDVNDNGLIGLGDTVPFSFLVTNTGTAAIANLVVNDPLLAGAGDTITCPVTALAAGASTTCTAEYTVTAADVTAGEVRNTATATGSDPRGATVTSNEDSTTTPVAAPAPGLTLDKIAAVTQYTAVGESIAYTFTVTNSGNVTTSAIAIVDDRIDAPATCDVTRLLPGAVATCTGVHTVTQADLDAGNVVNTATATGNDPDGGRVTSPPDSVTVTAVQTPALTLDKTTSATTYVAVGESIPYTFTVTNTGNVTVSGIAITDPLLTGAAVCDVTTLAPGGVASCTGSHVVSQADLDGGSVVNTATAGGVDPGGVPVVSPPDSVTVPADQRPALVLVKDAGVPAYAVPGDVIPYTFTVRNTGNVTVSGVAITDPRLSAPASCVATTVAPGGSVECTGSYTVTQDDVDAGSVTNTATTTGTDPSGDPVESPPATAVVPGPQPNPALALDKVAGVDTYAAVGDVVPYTFTVTNNGNVTVRDLVITDAKLDAAAVCAATRLAPAVSTTCTGAHTVTQADLDATELVNVATADGTAPNGDPVTSAPSTAVVPATVTPGVSMVKATSSPVFAKVGDVLDYTFTVTNTGNVTVTGIVITDPQLDAAARCETDSLAPGAEVVCAGVHTVTQADVDGGAVRNVATATVTPPGNNPPVTTPPSEVTVPGPDAAPKLELKKVANTPSFAKAGEKVDYTFTVTNTGNVTVRGITVKDAKLDAPATCDVTDLAPGKTATCRGVHTVTAEEFTARSVVNIATATGTPVRCPAGTTCTVESNASGTTTPAKTSPALATTGATPAWGILTTAGLTLMTGIVLLTLRARRRHNNTVDTP